MMELFFPFTSFKGRLKEKFGYYARVCQKNRQWGVEFTPPLPPPLAPPIEGGELKNGCDSHIF